ncbi:casein kinase II regulatory subunit-domain-containing protein [Myxozyma melibiosi]|uniref:Casein kinase II subunit beta n=1 Tax=Myxozyma melibiosi TaxID=54550 RepID=A0ABR1F176_9ASCO
MKGHEYFAEVTEDFIEDDFNLTGLSSLVPYYKEALDMILDFETDPDDAAHLPNIPIIENSADQLYGLIHARFLLTRQGLAVMAEKYDLAHFGSCPRYLCHSTPLLPIGTSDLPSRDTVKLYCPNCTDIYSPAGKEESEVDGAYFGTSFAGLFLKTYTDIPGPLGGLRIPASTAVSHPTPKQKQSQSQQSSHPQSGNGTDPTSTATSTSTATTTSSQQQPTSTSPTASASSTTSSASTTDRTTATPSSSEDAAVSTLLHDSDSKWEVFQMHLFGFKVSERARSGPRMRWLRERPRVLSDINPF